MWDEQIGAVRWVSREDSAETQDNTVAAAVGWSDEGEKAIVGTGTSEVAVGVMRPQGQAPYLRTHADGQWNNNLLSLDAF